MAFRQFVDLIRYVGTVDIEGPIRLREITAPTSIKLESGYLYSKDKSGVTELYYKNDDGTERDLSLVGGGLDHGGLAGLGDDDHTQYRLEADDHSHQSTGAQAGQLDHGLALTGLTDDDHTIYLLADGTRALSADWDAGAFEIRAQTFESDVVTGTAPLVIASTTLVSNLNADLLDGNDATAFETSGAVATHEADTTAIHGIADTSALLDTGDIGSSVQAFDAFLDDIAALTDPNDDRILFWDDSAGAITWLDIGLGLSLTDTTLAAGAAKGVLCAQGSNQTISDNTITAVSDFNEIFDTDGFHDDVTDPSRITIPAGEGGKYLFGCIAFWNNATDTMQRGLRFREGGSVFHTPTVRIREASDGVTEASTAMFAVIVADMAAADYMELMVIQNSGGDLTLLGDGAIIGSSLFWAVKIGS